MLDLQEDAGLEQLDSQVQRAQEQQLLLQRELERIEKQKRELEELSRKQEQFQQGRGDMVEQLGRALAIVEREAAEAQQRVEQLRAVEGTFEQHLAALEGINPKAWDPANVGRELNRALGAVDDARADYLRSRPLFAATAEPAPGEPTAEGGSFDEMFAGPSQGGFTHWLMVGFAFTLPLVLLGAAFLAVAVWLFHATGAAR